MTPPQLRAATEQDILRFAVALCSAADDEETVRRIIDGEMGEWSPGLQESILKVTLRVIVAQFYGCLARRIEREDPGCVAVALQAQAIENETGVRS